MLLIPIGSVRPQMTLAQPVLHPDREDLLLVNTGFELTERVIGQLKDARVTHLWIRVPGFDEIERDMTGSVNVAGNHMKLYQVLSRSIEQLEPRVAVRLNVNHYQDAVHHMLASIVDDPGHQVLTEYLSMCGQQLAGHLANCSYLALLIGAHLDSYLQQQRKALPADLAQNTSQLGLGALLHDIGKANMPDELRSKTALDPSSEPYRFHVSSGFEAVHEHVPAVAANVVLHHHERFDGSGYPGLPARDAPTPLAGEQIHVFSRIVTVVDVFDHLLFAGGQPVPTVVALAQLGSPRFAGWFDLTVVEALRRLVPPFGIGSLVRLSNGQRAAVVANHAESPCRPTVRLVSGSDLSVFAGERRQLDLRMCGDLVIADVDGFDVRPYLFCADGHVTSAA